MRKASLFPFQSSPFPPPTWSLAALTTLTQLQSYSFPSNTVSYSAALQLGISLGWGKQPSSQDSHQDSVLSCKCDGVFSFAIILLCLSSYLPLQQNKPAKVLCTVRSAQWVLSFGFAFALRQDVQSLCAISSPTSDTAVPNVLWK